MKARRYMPPFIPFSAHLSFGIASAEPSSWMTEPGWRSMGNQAVYPFSSSPGFSSTGNPTSPS